MQYKIAAIVVGGLFALLLLTAYVIEPLEQRFAPAPEAPPARVVTRPVVARVPVPVPTPPVPPAVVPLNLRVQNNGVALRITNRSSATYHGLLLRLVVNFDFNTYTATLIDIAPGKTILYDMREMTSFGGERFDPARYKPMVVIEQTLADGRVARWSGQ